MKKQTNNKNNLRLKKANNLIKRKFNYKKMKSLRLNMRYKKKKT